MANPFEPNSLYPSNPETLEERSSDDDRSVRTRSGDSDIRTRKLDSDPKARPSPDAVKWSFDGLEVGQRFQGKYEIVRMVGEGGMGQVYQAFHVDLRSMVAIKILNTSRIRDERAVERFKLEARASAKVVHPNAVRVFDYGVYEGVCFLVMEFLQGESLRRRIVKRKKFPLQEVIKTAEQICYVLEIMHNKGIIHRDLKPENIFLHKEERGEVVKVFDFGLAKMNTKHGAVSINTFGEKLTTEGMIVGTPHYMSPEQCLDLELDGRSDLYSLGIILYEMLSGSTPFESEKTMMVLSRHVSAPPPPLCEVEKDVPRAVSEVIQRVLSKAPEKRHQSAKEFLEDLCAAAEVKDSLYLKKIERESLKTSAVKKKPIVYIAAAVLAITAIGVAGLWSMRDAVSPQAAVPPEAAAGVQSSARLPIKSIGEDFVLIKGGKALIGIDKADCSSMIPDCKITDDETPSHQVEIAPFYLSKFEVANKEYREFVAAANYPPPKGIWKENDYPAGADDLPVTNVSWEDAMKYCEWRSKRDGMKYRLPTEDEWEYAARGGDRRLFPWGDNFDTSLANFGKPASVQTPLQINKAPNNTEDRSPFGIFAMAGNVSEWTASDFEPYVGSSYKPKKKDMKCKVIRGGNFTNDPNELRTTVRFWLLPSKNLYKLGFRLAAAPLENESK